MSTDDITRSEVTARGRALCARLATDVTKITPEGIGAWAGAWEIVAEADACFVAELTAWEASPSEDARLRVRTAYHAVLNAWRHAARRYNTLPQEVD